MEVPNFLLHRPKVLNTTKSREISWSRESTERRQSDRRHFVSIYQFLSLLLFFNEFISNVQHFSLDGSFTGDVLPLYADSFRRYFTGLV